MAFAPLPLVSQKHLSRRPNKQNTLIYIQVGEHQGGERYLSVASVDAGVAGKGALAVAEARRRCCAAATALRRGETAVIG